MVQLKLPLATRILLWFLILGFLLPLIGTIMDVVKAAPATESVLLSLVGRELPMYLAWLA